MKYGRYQVVRELGSGSMGVIYEAHDPDIDRTVALKVIRQDRITSEIFVERFLKEAKAIGRLSHPNIVTVYDVGQDNGMIYMAMEFLAGTSLDNLEKGSSLEEIVNIGIQIAEALHYAHQKGIVHRDIKPSNIIVLSNGQIKISDFGIAHIEDPATPQMTLAGEILGTPAYMAPEQVMGKPVDGRSDIFSLGCILYRLATGTLPFHGENLAATLTAVTQDTPREPREVNREIPKELSQIIMKCLKKAPDKRFQTGEAVAESLRGCLKEKKSKKPVLITLVSFLTACILAVFFSYLITGKAAKAILHVESMPSGAQVMVDGTLKGKAPLAVELPLGKYEVRLTLPDYYEWEAQVHLKEEGEKPLRVRLIPVE